MGSDRGRAVIPDQDTDAAGLQLTDVIIGLLVVEKITRSGHREKRGVSDQVAVGGPNRCPGPVVYTQFVEYIYQVSFDRIRADGQYGGYARIGKPLGHQAQHFQFPFGQGVFRGRLERHVFKLKTVEFFDGALEFGIVAIENGIGPFYVR